MKSDNPIIDSAGDKPAGEPGSAKSAKKRDLSFLVGTWQDDPAFDEAIADQDKVDEEMWR